MSNLNKLVQEKLAEMEAKEKVVRKNLQYLNNNKKTLRNPAQREFPPKEQPKQVPELSPQGDVITQEEVIPGMQSYIQAYLKMPAENMEEINKILPPTSSSRYFPMIYCLIAQTLKEIKEITEYKLSEYITTEEDLDLSSDTEEFRKKQEYLRSILSAEEKEQEEQQKNIVILIPDLLAKDNLTSKRAKELYPEILKLIHSIENGTFYRMRRLCKGNDNSMNGAPEVRTVSGVRIAYKQIGPNAYAIFAIFIKAKKDMRHHDFLVNRMREYEERAQQLKEDLTDEQFMKQQQELFNIFCEKLAAKDSDGINKLLLATKGSNPKKLVRK